MLAVRVLEYLDGRGRSPYSTWFTDLDASAAAKIATAVYRLAAGNFSNVKGAGEGVLERTIDFGPGYRIYFGRDGEYAVILLGRKQQAAARRCYRGGAGGLGRLQEAQ